MRRPLIILISLIFAAFGSAASAQAETLKGEARLLGERIAFDVEARYTQYVLTITGPEGYTARAQGARSAPTVRLADHGAVPDGVYRYQLTAATDRIAPGARRADHAANGREPGAGLARVGAALDGVFRVEDGRIQRFEQLDEPAAGEG